MDKDLLYRFFEGHASITEMKRVKEWAEANDENRALFRRERKLFDTMLVIGDPKRKTNLTIKTHRKDSLLKEFIKIAAVIILSVGTTASLFLAGKENVNVAMQTITTPPGQRVNLSLPDGSDVWLNAGTTITYPTTFTKDKREVTLDGEAYFDVAHNEECPFIVHTHAMDIEVLGTAFDVEAYSDRNTFEASLIRGKIKVESPLDKKLSLILSPDHKTTLKEGKLVVSKIQDYDVYRWKEGLYCFRDKTFGEVMGDLEKYYDLTIKLEKKDISGIVLTGKFRISEGLDYALRVLQMDVPFTYNRNTDQNIIYIN